MVSVENIKLVNFEKVELLTYEEFETMITSFIPLVKCELMRNKLSNRVLFNKGDLYLFQPNNILYKRVEETKEMNNEDLILSLCRNILQNSFINFNKEQQEVLQMKYKDIILSKIFKINYCKDFVKDIILYLTKNNIDFNDPNKYEIHFRNGCYNLKKNKLMPRDKKKHFISIYINRDYEDPTPEIILEILREIFKMIPNKNDGNYIFSNLGKSLTGEAINDQTNLFLLGCGSNGKSVLMKMLKCAIDIYMVELKNNTFTEGNNKIDKILNEFKEKAYLRVAWINEMEDKKLDQSLFKNFCEGLLQTTSLYKDGMNNFKHFCKLIFTANTFPRIIIDGGTVRRIEAYEFQSKFVDDKKDVNESKNIYLKDTTFLDRYENDEIYQNAFFKILANYCYEWIEDKNKYPRTENFDETKNKVVNLNDTIQEFIDNYLEITKNDNDRISKNELYELFLSTNPKSIMKDTQLISALNQKGIEYSFKKRNNEGKQGAYIGVKIKEQQPIENPLDHGIEYKFGKNNTDEKDEIIDRQNKEIEELKAKIKLLEEQLKPKEEIKPKEEAKIETIEDQLNYKDIDDVMDKTIKRTKKNKSTKAKRNMTDDDIDATIDLI